MQPKLVRITNCFIRSALSVLLICLATTAFSQTIKGKVFDVRTGDPVVGATVQLEETKYSTMVNLDGTYIVKNVKPGKYEVEVSLAGYKKPTHLEVTVNENSVGMADFQLEETVTNLTEGIVASRGRRTRHHSLRKLVENLAMVHDILMGIILRLLP